MGTRLAPCRLCAAPLTQVVVDLGMSPLANRYLEADQLGDMEPFYPLRVLVCDRCWLVQLEEMETPAAIFTDYAYFSSYSRSWLEHCRQYVEAVSDRFGLGPRHQVIEIASNDGYLLQYFVARGVPVLGIEPAANVAAAALERGIPTRVEFFGRMAAERLVAQGVRADLLVGNNVFAHVPALHDFVAGLRTVLAPGGVLTLEFPHLLRLLAETQFDTIYHEHFSYFSLATAEAALAAHGLAVFDVEELPTHGGSLRLYACHENDRGRPREPRVEALREREAEAGLQTPAAYQAFGAQVQEVKRSLLEFLIGARREGKSVVGYGAAAKGNTLLNYCGIRTDFLDYTVDRSPAKQGRYLPGTHVPIHGPERIAQTRPDYVLVLPWNLQAEIVEQMAYVREWGGRFVVPIPEVKVLG
jgi:SAM-dependent methyltransferase